MADWVGKVITSDLRMVVTPNLYRKEEAPQWGRFVHAGGISDGELMFPSPPPSLPRRPENYLKNVRAGDVDVRRVESGCALAGLWL